MLRKLMIGTAAACLGAAAFSLPAAAQGVDVEIDARPLLPPRAIQPQPAYPVVERRVYRSAPVIDDNEEECRIVIRRGVNRYGEYVERRMRICE